MQVQTKHFPFYLSIMGIHTNSILLVYTHILKHIFHALLILYIQQLDKSPCFRQNTNIYIDENKLLHNRQMMIVKTS